MSTIPKDLRDGLLVQLDCIGNPNDTSGNDNHGILSSTYVPALTTDYLGRLDRAYNFHDATSSNRKYITLTNSITPSAMTICFRIKVDGDSSGSYANLLIDQANYNFQLFRNDSTGIFAWYSTASGVVNFSYAIPTGSQIYIILTISGTTANLYINGAFEETQTLTLGTTAGANVEIGGRSDANDNLNGSMSKIRIYDYAISQDLRNQLTVEGIGDLI